MLADEYYGRNDDGHYDNSQDAFNAVRCVDAPVAEGSGGLGGRRPPDTPSRAVHVLRAVHRVCAARPVRAVAGARDVVAAPAAPVAPGKVVVVSTTHDPATPYQAGVDLARQLGAALITYEGTQHTVVFNGDQCVDSAVVSYLVDGVAPGNLRC